MLLETYQTFEPDYYLNEYYSHIDLENLSLLEFFAHTYQNIPSDSVMLEFSGGPGIYSLISAAKQVKEIHFSDFLSKNLQEVELWQRFRHRSQFWQNYFKEALVLEGETEFLEAKITQRENLLRNKLTQFLLCDAFEENPLGIQRKEYYDVVAANFVAESITTSRGVWESIIGHICSTLKKGGTLIMSSIQGAEFYSVNGKRYPAVPVTEKDLMTVLMKLNFHPDNIHFQSIPAEITDIHDPNYKGYQGMLFVEAHK